MMFNLSCPRFDLEKLFMADMNIAMSIFQLITIVAYISKFYWYKVDTEPLEEFFYSEDNFSSLILHMLIGSCTEPTYKQKEHHPKIFPIETFDGFALESLQQFSPT